MNFSGSSPKIYFRLDYGGLIGRGHLSRCLSLAQSFSEIHLEPVFVIRKRPGIEKEVLPFKTLWLKNAPDVNSCSTSSWKSGSEEEEGLELLSLLEEESTIFLDHYALGTPFIDILQKNNHRVFLIQDISDESVEADLIINYNLNALSQYKKQKETYLLGPGFAPLNPNFKTEHKLRFNKDTQIKNVGLYLGGIDFELIEKLASAISKTAFFENKKIEWVVNNEKEKEQLSHFLKDERFHIYARLPSLLDLYKRTDLFIGACGLSFLERACLGLLQFNFLVADNQSDVAKAMDESGAGFLLGDLRLLDEKTLRLKLEDYCQLKRDQLCARVERAFMAVDGRGAEQVAMFCQKQFKLDWRFRKIELNDSAMVLSWRNDPLIYRYLFHPSPVPEADHEKWMQKIINSDSAVFLIAEYQGTPAGTIRFDFEKENQEAEIGIYLAPQFHGQGLSRHLLMNAGKQIKENYPMLKKITAKVLLDNLPSLKMFLSAGYTKVAVEDNFQRLEKVLE